jgi:Uma2 family endonuclease
MQLPLELRFQSCKLSDEQFWLLCQDNRELRLERNSQGDLEIMPPTGGVSGHINAKLTQRLANWAEADGTGIFFDSSSGFKLPDGSERSPDAAWIPLEKWENLTPEQREKFLPLCPDFVVELRSVSDNLAALRRKMEQYLANGTRLGWLLNRLERQVEIYRPQQAVEILDNPRSLSGEEVLKGFILDLDSLW